MKQIGRELNVRYVLEGSVQRGGGCTRVNVQLVDAETGNHVWAERFDKRVADLFEMQDEIVSRLANELGVELNVLEARRSEKARSPRFDRSRFSGDGLVSEGPDPRERFQSARFFRASPEARP